MISRSLNLQVSLYTSHGRRVHTWGQYGRCTVQDRTSSGRTGYLDGTSPEDKMPYLNGCTPENRHMTEGGIPAGNGAPNTEHRITNTEDNTMNYDYTRVNETEPSDQLMKDASEAYWSVMTSVESTLIRLTENEVAG